ncbi:MAG: nuclear transport factor 2 family protein [Gemmatimonadetes bacterium]|nr:nuclear transport factor 2 family protein [Gemmatimonadota bacterium]
MRRPAGVSGRGSSRPRRTGSAAGGLAVLGGALLLLCGVASAAPAGVAAQSADEPSPEVRAAVLAPVQRLFDAINSGDAALAREVMSPDAHVAMLGPGGVVLGADGLADMVAGATETWVERMWSPEVRVRADLASVWAPYDFYRDGRFSHCGIDAFHLERREAGWRIVSLVWVREQPPACALHPEGPPP